jgi:hypothetical protein
MKQKQLLNKIKEALNILDLEIGNLNTELPILKTVKELYLEIKLKKSLDSFLPIYIKSTNNNEQSAIKLIDLIDNFYINRNTEMQYRIMFFYIGITRDIGCDYILKTQSSDIWALKEDSEEKNKVYKIFYKEFEDFADFIKQEYSK